jgi:hypothetical protein
MGIGAVLYTSEVFLPAVTGERKSKFRNIQYTLRSPQVLGISGLMIGFALIYYLVGIGEQASGYFINWTIFTRWQDVLDPSFYMRWMIRVDDILMVSVVFAGFIGTMISEPKNRALLLGFWGGYGLLGLTFPHHIVTHDYYHLPLVALVALSIIHLANVVITKVTQQGKVIQTLFAGIVLIFFAYNGWIGRSILLGQDFRDHPAFWQKVGEAFPANTKAIGLTQDYGYRLMYYGWRKIALWPQDGDSSNFSEKAEGANFFVVTAKNRLSNDLATYLDQNFPVHAKGTGYQIYDLGE